MSKQPQHIIHPTPIVIIDIDNDQTAHVNQKPISGHPKADTAFETAIWYVAEHYAADAGRPVQTYAHLPGHDTARMNITPDAQIEKLPMKTSPRPTTPARAATPAPARAAEPAATNGGTGHLHPVPTDNTADSLHTDSLHTDTDNGADREPDRETATDNSNSNSNSNPDSNTSGDGAAASQPSAAAGPADNGTSPAAETGQPADNQVRLTQRDLDSHNTTVSQTTDNDTRPTADDNTTCDNDSARFDDHDGVTTDDETVWSVRSIPAAEPAPLVAGAPSPPWPTSTAVNSGDDPPAEQPDESDTTANQTGSKEGGDSAEGQMATRLNLHELARNQQDPATHSRWRQLLRLGPSKAERDHHQRLARIRTTPATGSTFVGATFQMKGGDGKTTTALLTAQAIAENTGLATVVVSADPANGNLLQRAVDFGTDDELMAHPTAIDLYEAEMQARNQGRIGLTDAHAIGRHLALAGRLRVLGAQQVIHDDSDDTTDTGLKAHQVDILIQVLSRVFDVIIFDCGTSPTTAAFKTLLRLSHGAILVSNPSWDVLHKGQQSLDFIEYRRPDILARATMACIQTPISVRQPTTFDLDATLHRLSDRLTTADNRPGRQPVAHVPYDPTIINGTAIHWSRLQPATQRAALDLAAQFADIWAGNATINHPAELKGQPA